MINYKQKLYKRKIPFFIAVIFIVLFLMLSFSSINNVYGYDSENILSDIGTFDTNDSLAIDLNQNSLSLDDNLNYINEYSQNISNETNNSEEFNNFSKGNNLTINSNANSYLTSSNNHLISPNIHLNYYYSSSNYLIFSLNFPSNLNSFNVSNNLFLTNEFPIFVNDNNIIGSFNNNKFYLTTNSINIEKNEENSLNLDNIKFNTYYSISQYFNFNDYIVYYSDINDYINNHVVVFISNSTSYSNFNGNGFENFNNFIKEVSNIKFNKIDDEEYTSVITPSQSGLEPTANILLFIKIFMEHHDNGKEHQLFF